MPYTQQYNDMGQFLINSSYFVTSCPIAKLYIFNENYFSEAILEIFIFVRWN